jgi:dTDP-4-amino-4,6-dideoxygalactose transaminase
MTKLTHVLEARAAAHDAPAGVVEDAWVPFVRPHVATRQLEYITESLHSGHHSGDGPFTARASALISELVGGGEVLLTTSCTHALEMSAMLLDLEAGDEVIMPSFTFVSTANAFVLAGATPVFVDCRPDTLNIDERQLEAAISERTRAIVVVHYAGVACEMDAILGIAERRGIPVIEDNAHGLGGSYRGRPLGSFGAMATQSFHETKNVSCGEGGALVINDGAYLDRAEIIREKGTNRSQFFRGAVDKYRWVDKGSSYLPAELLAAGLTAQLEDFPLIQAARLHAWERYITELPPWAAANGVTLPTTTLDVQHPAHIFWLLMPTAHDQGAFISHLKRCNVGSVFHYVPLHSSPYGERAGRAVPQELPVVSDISARVVRLPLWGTIADDSIDRVVAAVTAWEQPRLTASRRPRVEPA